MSTIEICDHTPTHWLAMRHRESLVGVMECPCTPAIGGKGFILNNMMSIDLASYRLNVKWDGSQKDWTGAGGVVEAEFSASGSVLAKFPKPDAMALLGGGERFELLPISQAEALTALAITGVDIWRATRVKKDGQDSLKLEVGYCGRMVEGNDTMPRLTQINT